jgi:hypothetical protein
LSDSPRSAWTRVDTSTCGCDLLTAGETASGVRGAMVSMHRCGPSTEGARPSRSAIYSTRGLA